VFQDMKRFLDRCRVFPLIIASAMSLSAQGASVALSRSAVERAGAKKNCPCTRLHFGAPRQDVIFHNGLEGSYEPWTPNEREVSVRVEDQSNSSPSPQTENQGSFLSVPEPGTGGIMTIGLLLLTWQQRRYRKHCTCNGGP